MLRPSLRPGMSGNTKPQNGYDVIVIGAGPAGENAAEVAARAGLRVAIVEKQSRFVRFHGFQSLLLHAAVIVISICLGMGQIVLGMMAGVLGLLAWLVSLVVGLAFLGVAIMMMVKAYGNEEYELPVIGEMARKWA